MLAVTAQNAGPDGEWQTQDDLLVPMNSDPCPISIDHSTGNQQDDPLDRVRGFGSAHPGGCQFGFGDGSVRFVQDTIDLNTYRNLSSINGSEVQGEF